MSAPGQLDELRLASDAVRAGTPVPDAAAGWKVNEGELQRYIADSASGQLPEPAPCAGIPPMGVQAERQPEASQQRAEHQQAETTESADPAKELGVLTREQVRDLPPVEPLIESTVDRRSLAVLAGPWGSAKTFVGLDWACCVASGKPWQARAVHGPQGEGDSAAALYVSGEGAYGLNARISAWETARRADADRLLILPSAVNLTAPSEVARLTDVLRQHCIRLLVIDTLSRCTPGVDENNAKDMSLVVHYLDRLRTATEDGVSVIVVHHTGKDRVTVRGSSVLEGAADCVYQSDANGRQIRLTRTKRKDGPLPDVHTLTLDPVAGTDSVVLSATAGTTNASERVLSAFVSAFEHTGASKAELRNVASMPSASFHRGLDALVSSGTLVNRGSEKRPFYKLQTSELTT